MVDTPDPNNKNLDKSKPDSLIGLDYDTKAILLSILELSPLSVVLSDLTAKIINVSRATVNLLGYSKPEDIIGKNAFDFIDPRDHARARENLKKRSEAGILDDIDYHFVRKDKSLFPGELRITVLRDARDKPIAFIGILHDKTDVQETREKFQFLFEIAPIGVGIIDARGRILLANRTLHDIFAYPGDAMINMQARDLFASNTIPSQILSRMRQMGEVVKYEAEFQKKGGITFWGSMSLKKFEFYGKTTYITAFTDISEQKKAEDTLQSLLQEAIKVSDMKTDIITNASHELKTPLIPIIGWSDFILKAKRNGQSLDQTIEMEDLESILRNANRLQHIIDDFLDVGRLQKHKLVLDFAWISLNDLVIAAIRAVIKQAEPYHINLHNKVENISLFVDGFRFEQVLVNLLSNSIKYSPENSNVWIRSKNNGKVIEITVEDEGFGFTPEELKEALQPFSPSFLHGKGTQIFAGTGVGLYICKGIVEQHGGTINVSSPGKNLGTKVTITLPHKEPKPHKDNLI